MSIHTSALIVKILIYYHSESSVISQNVFLSNEKSMDCSYVEIHTLMRERYTRRFQRELYCDEGALRDVQIFPVENHGFSGRFFKVATLEVNIVISIKLPAKQQWPRDIKSPLG